MKLLSKVFSLLGIHLLSTLLSTTALGHGRTGLGRRLGHALLRKLAHAPAWLPPTLELDHTRQQRIEPVSFARALASAPPVQSWVAEFNERIFTQARRRARAWHHIERNLLPDSIYSHDDFHAFNGHYQFMLRTVLQDGYTANLIFIKEHTGRSWRLLKIPREVRSFREIHADDQYLIAISEYGTLYTLLLIDETFKEDNPKWTRHWGSPIWLGDGDNIPFGSRCLISHFSPYAQLVSSDTIRRWEHTPAPVPVENPQKIFGMQDYVRLLPSFLGIHSKDREKDTGGRYHCVGVGVTTSMILEPGGQFIKVSDPWLKNKDIRKITSPGRGSIPLHQIDLSASMIAGLTKIQGRKTVYTRSWDFDISGGNRKVIFYRTSPHGFGRRVPIMDPNLDIDWWDLQPPLPEGAQGPVSVTSYGSHKEFYLVQVIGRSHVYDKYNRYLGIYDGFYFKDVEQGVVQKSGWQFQAQRRAPDQVLVKPDDIPNITYLYPVPHTYNSRGFSTFLSSWFQTGTLFITAFNPYEGPTLITGTLHSGLQISLWLHNFDLTRFRHPRLVNGLDENPWPQIGLLQLPTLEIEKLNAAISRGDAFASDLMSKVFKGDAQEGYFAEVEISVTSSELELNFKGDSTWIFGLERVY